MQVPLLLVMLVLRSCLAHSWKAWKEDNDDFDHELYFVLINPSESTN